MTEVSDTSFPCGYHHTFRQDNQTRFYQSETLLNTELNITKPTKHPHQAACEKNTKEQEQYERKQTNTKLG